MRIKVSCALLFISLFLSGCFAAIPLEDLTAKSYPCKEQLAKSLKEMVVNDFALALEVKLMAVNDVSCVDRWDTESMANIAVVALGSKNDFSEPREYYAITHIHFSAKHGGFFGEAGESWIEMKTKNEWFRDWCINFIRWAYPKEWDEQGCSVFGGMEDGHKIQ